MSRKRTAQQPDTGRDDSKGDSTQFEQFETFARCLFAVPREEIDAEAEKEKAAKRRQRNGQ